MTKEQQKELENFSDSTLFSFLREVRHKAFISWGTDDVTGRASEIGFVMDESIAINIIGDIDRAADCTIGVTWDTIDFHIEDWIAKNSFNVVIKEFSDGEERTAQFCSLTTNENIEEFWNDDEYYFYGLSKDEIKSFIGKGEMVGDAIIIKVD